MFFGVEPANLSAELTADENLIYCVRSRGIPSTQYPVLHRCGRNKNIA
jgi:hypothetical protein